jgi:phospholipid/cholesterol/gamma-HCH transport system permease protein
LNRRELARELVHFGHGSLPLAVGVATLTGATVVLQTRLYVERFGARAFMGWAAGYAVLWELGPLLLGLLLAARVGARNAAELATLTVGGQIEGLRGVSLDPFGLLVAPRVVALIVSSLTLSSVAFGVAIAWEAAAARLTLALPLKAFWANFSDMLSPKDLLGGVIKALAFGIAIALISTTIGLRATGGARAVGQAAASAVVSSCATIFALDFLLTPLLTRWLT